MSRQYLFLLDQPPADLLFGHYLGIFAILLQIAGFWAVARGLAPAGRAAAGSYFFLAASTMALGAAFHATFAPIGLALHAMAGDSQRIAAIADAVRPAQTALGAIVVLGIIAAALFFSVLVLRRRTAFPRWMAAVTPLTLAVVLWLAARLAPSLRLVAVPCGLNGAAMIFFLLATIVLWNRTDWSC